MAEYAGDRSRADLTLAWSAAVLHRMDIKQFPKSPEDLLKRQKDPQQQMDTLVSVAKTLKSQHDRAKKRDKKKPDIVIHKEI